MMYPRVFFLCFLPLLLVSHFSLAVVDAVGKEVALETPATRIISLSPHITELLYAAGAGDKVVGVVEGSDYPEEVKSLPSVGNYSGLSIETIVSLKPDLIMAWYSGNSGKTIAKLESLGIPLFFSEPKKIEDIFSDIQKIGQLANTQTVANAEVEKLQNELSDLRLHYSQKEPISIFYQIALQPLLTINGHHMISDVISLCGGRNVFAEAIPLVPQVSIESIVVNPPDVVVLGAEDNYQKSWFKILEKKSHCRDILSSSRLFLLIQIYCIVKRHVC